jgi:O-6-methylguanine DNA methyltransferase
MRRYAAVAGARGPWFVAYRGEAPALVANVAEAAFLARATAAFGAAPLREAAAPATVAGRLRRAAALGCADLPRRGELGELGEPGQVGDGAEADDAGPVDLDWLTPFQRRVIEVVRGIPRGGVRSYGWVAGAAGYPRAARAVGTTLAHNPLGPLVPCHRVRRADGTAAPWPGAGATAARDLRLAREGADLALLAWVHRRGGAARP